MKTPKIEFCYESNEYVIVNGNGQHLTQGDLQQMLDLLKERNDCHLLTNYRREVPVAMHYFVD